MKRRILVTFSAVLILGLVIAAYAFQANTAAPVEKAACCDMADCCCKNGKGGMNHDSCPMKGKHDNAVAATAATAEGSDCCCDCCKGSCPMHKKS